jgi:hypothetical protein
MDATEPGAPRSAQSPSKPVGSVRSATPSQRFLPRYVPTPETPGDPQGLAAADLAGDQGEQ